MTDVIVALLTAEQAAVIGIAVWVGLMLLVLVAGPMAWHQHCNPAPERVKPHSHRAPTGWREPLAVVVTTVMDLWAVAAAVAGVAWSAYVESESWRVA